MQQAFLTLRFFRDYWFSKTILGREGIFKYHSLSARVKINTGGTTANHGASANTRPVLASLFQLTNTYICSADAF